MNWEGKDDSVINHDYTYQKHKDMRYKHVLKSTWINVYIICNIDMFLKAICDIGKLTLAPSMARVRGVNCVARGVRGEIGGEGGGGGVIQTDQTSLSHWDFAMFTEKIYINWDPRNGHIQSGWDIRC